MLSVDLEQNVKQENDIFGVEEFLNTTNSEIDSKNQNHPKKKTRVSIACCHCQKAHVCCDTARPCKRCVDRGMADSCVDGKVQKRGRKGISFSIDYFNSQVWKNNPLLQFGLQSPVEQPIMKPNNNEKSSVNPFGQSVAPQSLDATLLSLLKDDSPIVDIPNNLFTDYNFNQTAASTNEFLNDQSLQHIDLDPTNVSFFQDIAPFPITPTFSTTYVAPPNNNNASKNPFRTPTASNDKPSGKLNGKKSAGPTPILLTEDYSECLYKFIQQKVNDPELDAVKAAFSLGVPNESDSSNHFFNMYLNMFRSTFEEVATPTLLWDRSGVIHFANRAFTDLTGFSQMTPTDPNNFALVRTFSRGALRKILRAMTNNFHDISFSSMTISGGILRWNILEKVQEEQYIKGTMSITWKRDLLGMPLIFLCNFLPAKDELKQK